MSPPIVVPLAPGTWYRCSKVVLSESALTYHLDRSRSYDLEAAYQKDPHMQFANCESDADIARFSRSWGPLFLVRGGNEDETQTGIAVRPIAQLRAEVRRFKAVKALVEAAKGNGYERGALREFLEADQEECAFGPLHRLGELPNHQFMLKTWLRAEGDVIAWLDRAPAATMRSALKFCVESEVTIPWTGGVRVVPHRGKTKVVPSYNLTTLQDALRWMVWFDEWNTNPPLACPSCHKIFRPTSRNKKYCTHQCAHRIAVQNYRSRKRQSLASRPRFDARGKAVPFRRGFDQAGLC